MCPRYEGKPKDPLGTADVGRDRALRSAEWTDSLGLASSPEGDVSVVRRIMRKAEDPFGDQVVLYLVAAAADRLGELRHGFLVGLFLQQLTRLR